MRSPLVRHAAMDSNATVATSIRMIEAFSGVQTKYCACGLMEAVRLAFLELNSVSRLRKWSVFSGT